MFSSGFSPCSLCDSRWKTFQWISSKRTNSVLADKPSRMLNLDHAGGQSAKTAQRFETWHRLRYYVFEPELQRPLFQHFDVASRFLQVFFPKRKTSLQRITPQAMNKSSPFLPDPMEDGKLAINAFAGGFRTPSIFEALGDIGVGPTNMDDFGIWKPNLRTSG